MLCRGCMLEATLHLPQNVKKKDCDYLINRKSKTSC